MCTVRCVLAPGPGCVTGSSPLVGVLWGSDDDAVGHDACAAQCWQEGRHESMLRVGRPGRSSSISFAGRGACPAALQRRRQQLYLWMMDEMRCGSGQ